MPVCENIFIIERVKNIKSEFLRKLLNSSLCEIAFRMDCLALVHGENAPTASSFCLTENNDSINLRLRSMVELGEQSTGGWEENEYQLFLKHVFFELKKRLHEAGYTDAICWKQTGDGLPRVLSFSAPGALGETLETTTLKIQILSPIVGIKWKDRHKFETWFKASANSFMDRVREHGNDDYLAMLVEWRKKGSGLNSSSTYDTLKELQPTNIKEKKSLVGEIIFENVPLQKVTILMLFAQMGIGKGTAHGMGGVSFFLMS